MPGYVFYDGRCHDGSSLPVVEIQVPERTVHDIEYYNYTWPCAVELSRYLIEQRKTLCGQRVLEIGCGTALPSAVAARLGIIVVTTDQSTALHVCRNTLEVNNLLSGDSVAVSCFVWADEKSFSELIANPVCQNGFDIILCSDCYYDDAVIADVTVTLSMLLRQWPNAYVLCAYQVRDVEWLSEIDAALRAFQLQRISVEVNDSIECLVTTSTANSSPGIKRKYLNDAEIKLWRIERRLVT